MNYSYLPQSCRCCAALDIVSSSSKVIMPEQWRKYGRATSLSTTDEHTHCGGDDIVSFSGGKHVLSTPLKTQ